MTQKEVILDILSDGLFHCTNDFYSAFIADPRARLHEIQKKTPYVLEWAWCDIHPHKKSKKWRLIGGLSKPLGQSDPSKHTSGRPPHEIASKPPFHEKSIEATSKTGILQAQLSL